MLCPKCKHRLREGLNEYACIICGYKISKAQKLLYDYVREQRAKAPQRNKDKGNKYA